MSSPAESPLSREQATEVLRYWLASVQLEEALSARPRARRVAPSAPIAPRVATPVAGQDYFKLPLDAALLALLCKGGSVTKALDAELSGFFESWLVDQYRRGQDDRELTHLVAFPVVHLARGELAGLLRYGVQLRFSQPGGAAFKVPTRSERRRQQFPPPPSELRLQAAGRGARQWPFFVDTRLLNQQLGITRESIDELFDALRAEPELDEARMLELVCTRLEREAELAPPPSAAGREAEVLARLTAAMSALLAKNAARARVYPVGVVVDGTRAKTTWYLQRELQMLLEERAEVEWELESCLGSYLRGSAAVSGRQVQRALFRGPSLSPSQRAATEHAWGSALSAVQGPPGTGKTTLIVHMAAEALVRQVSELADRGEPGKAAFVITSTNNRAVDNVIDPLNGAGGLPLALRAGSQRVCEQVLAPQLEAAHAWLERARTQPADQRRAALQTTLDHFRQLRAQLDERLAEYARSCELQNRRSSLRAELDALAGAGGTTEPDAFAQVDAHALQQPLQRLYERLRRLCVLCHEAQTLGQLQGIDSHFQKTAKRALPELQLALAQAKLELELPLPPALPPTLDAARLIEAWEEAATSALDKLEALQLALARVQGRARQRQRVRTLEDKLAALGSSAVPERPDCEALERALFEAAVAAREAWAAAQCDELSRVVQRALATVRGEFSLRTLWNDDERQWLALKALFGIWGCTLLSLGNCFPAQQGAIEQVVIDEAGQCHPTYAVSALLRARRALIIGDVHQLEPVIELEPADDERVLQACQLALPAKLLAPYRVSNASRCSVQALADRAVRERPRLIEHFRCQPEIIAISDALCSYGLQVETPFETPSAPLPFLPDPVSLIDVQGEQQRLGGSWYNAAEVAQAVELLNMLLRAGIDPNEIALITPYRAQLEQLQKQLQRQGVPIDRSVEMLELELPELRAAGGVALGTVHRFQGGERSIVIFSSVVTRRSSLAFLDQRENLLNVAVSRARHRLIAIGQRALLASGSRTVSITRAASPLMAASFREQQVLL